MPGANGEVWQTDDPGTVARMNQKTILIDTGSAINSATTYAGMMAYCISSGSGFIADTLYERNAANSAWVPVGSTQQPYLTLSTTIGDYTAPNAAVATSTGYDTPSTTTISGVFGFDHGLYSGSRTRSAENFGASAALIGRTLTQFSFWLKKSGSPTGTLYFRVYDSGDSLVSTFGTLDVSTLTTSYVEYSSGTGATRVLTSGDRVCVEYSGGDSSNKVLVEVAASDLYDTSNTQTDEYNGSWTPNPDNDYHSSFTTGATFTASKIYDTDTGTRWQSTSENTPAIYVDLSGSAREIVGVALNIDKTNTTATSIKVRASTDTSFADAENIAYVNISDFTDDTWRFLANNFLTTNCRYVQVIANENSCVLAINEIKVRYGVTDAVKILGHRHRTRNVTTADSFTDSN